MKKLAIIYMLPAVWLQVESVSPMCIHRESLSLKKFAKHKAPHFLLQPLYQKPRVFKSQTRQQVMYDVGICTIFLCHRSFIPVYYILFGVQIPSGKGIGNKCIYDLGIAVCLLKKLLDSHC